jgi:hypothetical protein
MSDLDEVLERLLTDTAFQHALAADPDAALAGYHLDAPDRDLLRTQLVLGGGADRTVEERTSKAGLVGLLGPVAAAFGVASGPVSTGTQSLGSAPGGATFGNAPGLGGVNGDASFGSAPGAGVGGSQTFGDAVGGPSQTFGSASPTQTFGSAAPGQTFGSAVPPATMGAAPVPATDYHTHVDVNGDGVWDSYTAYERPDGGVDIHVDLDHDGVDDFVGHDVNRDGLVDYAEFDTDHDGVMDTRMTDDTGDGWMDRSERI